MDAMTVAKHSVSACGDGFGEGNNKHDAYTAGAMQPYTGQADIPTRERITGQCLLEASHYRRLSAEPVVNASDLCNLTRGHPATP